MIFNNNEHMCFDLDCWLFLNFGLFQKPYFVWKTRQWYEFVICSKPQNGTFFIKSKYLPQFDLEKKEMRIFVVLVMLEQMLEFFFYRHLLSSQELVPKMWILIFLPKLDSWHSVSVLGHQQGYELAVPLFIENSNP